VINPALPVLLFADRLPPLTGGMEMHAGAFVRHFAHHERFPLVAVVTRDDLGRDCLLAGGALLPIDLTELSARLPQQPAVVFFNSGRWIEDLAMLRAALPQALFVYRTGGNEILKAPIERRAVKRHEDRQRYWVEQLATNLDMLVTNSAFTDARLRELGVPQSLFRRCVGGVDLDAAQPKARPTGERTRLFCAARFVPYKNHALLLQVCGDLARRGHVFDLRLAGDGPLLEACVQLVAELGLQGYVQFLGRLDNDSVCRELMAADAYVQFSVDQVTPVPGGSYVHAEGMGRSVLEAVSYGTFVIALRSGALPEIVTPGRGLLLTPGPVREVTDQVEAILAAGIPRPVATDEYGWHRYFEHYETMWETCLATSACH
jgi:glycosyltransferase involved in cell wall biosynthesis